VSRFREEIGEQPDIAARQLTESRPALDAIAKAFAERRPRGFVIAARGSSDHAADYGRYLFGRRQRALVSLAAPSMFTHYASPPRLDGQCVIGISQSGASPDVIAVVEEGAKQGALTLAITNDAGSPLARAASLVLPLLAGPELSVPASKTYVSSLLALALVSAAITPDPDFQRALEQVPAKLRDVLDMDASLVPLAQALTGPRAIVLGRGFNLCTAEEVALKLTETSYVLARAWSTADFVHGPIAVVEPGFPVLLIGAGGSVAGDIEAIARKLTELSCRVVGLFDAPSAPLPDDAVVRIDSGLPEELTPLTLAVLGQLLAHQVALAKGVDPDVPRTLRKVTRTW
jgi:glucosamine--fructose-6-phosphate aminotransferase (isomerizing)